MNFQRVKTKKRNYKIWKSEERYRITWCDKYLGVAVPAHFQACVRVHLPEGRDIWDFAGKRGPYKTFKAADKACCQHQRLWTKILQATGIRRVRELCGKIPSAYPLWIRKEMSSKLRILLESANRPGNKCDNDLTETSMNEVVSSQKRGRASLATELEEDQKRRLSLRTTRKTAKLTIHQLGLE